MSYSVLISGSETAASEFVIIGSFCVFASEKTPFKEDIYYCIGYRSLRECIRSTNRGNFQEEMHKI